MDKKYEFDMDKLIPELMTRVMGLEIINKAMMAHYLVHLKRYHPADEYEAQQTVLTKSIAILAQQTLAEHTWMQAYWDDVIKDLLPE
jgi:hypothetical protein